MLQAQRFPGSQSPRIPGSHAPGSMLRLTAWRFEIFGKSYTSAIYIYIRPEELHLAIYYIAGALPVLGGRAREDI